MLKIYTILATLLLVFGVSLLLSLSQRRSLPEDQAGVAYIEGADGKLVKADSVRPAEKTAPPSVAELPVGKKSDGTDEWLTSWELTERTGKQVRSEDLKGQPYVASFFFSTCVSVCRLQNENVQQLQKKFLGKPVRFVSISCDPEVDRPEVLTEYAQRYGADKDQWLFLTGNLEYIRRVGAEVYSLAIMRYAHPEKFVLMDANGKAYGFYTWSDPNQWRALQADIEKLMSAGGAIAE